MDIFDLIEGVGVDRLDSRGPQDPQWAKSPAGRFHRFVHLDPEEAGLSGVSGVFVIWHGGVHPEWVYLGKSRNLASTLHKLGNNQDIMGYEVNGWLFVSWALIRDKHQDGVVKYLVAAMKPKVENREAPGDKAIPIPVLAPGTEADD